MATRSGVTVRFGRQCPPPPRLSFKITRDHLGSLADLFELVYLNKRKCIQIIDESGRSAELCSSTCTAMQWVPQLEDTADAFTM